MKEPSVPITKAYYQLDEEQQRRYRKLTDQKIRQGADPVLKRMRNIVKGQLRGFIADFYVHDVSHYKKAEGDPFLWVIRQYGTHIVDLTSEDYLNGIWEPKNHLRSLLRCGKEIKGIYLIHKGSVKKLSDIGAIATISVFEDEIQTKFRLAKQA